MSIASHESLESINKIHSQENFTVDKIPGVCNFVVNTTPEILTTPNTGNQKSQLDIVFKLNSAERYRKVSPMYYDFGLYFISESSRTTFLDALTSIRVFYTLGENAKKKSEDDETTSVHSARSEASSVTEVELLTKEMINCIPQDHSEVYKLPILFNRTHTGIWPTETQSWYISFKLTEPHTRGFDMPSLYYMSKLSERCIVVEQKIYYDKFFSTVDQDFVRQGKWISGENAPGILDIFIIVNAKHQTARPIPVEKVSGYAGETCVFSKPSHVFSGLTTSLARLDKPTKCLDFYYIPMSEFISEKFKPRLSAKFDMNLTLDLKREAYDGSINFNDYTTVIVHSEPAEFAY